MNLKNSFFSVGFFLLLGAFLLSGRTTNSIHTEYKKLVADWSVEDVLLKLGEDKPLHYIASLNKDSVQMGYELITTGKISTGKNKLQSKYFVCTDCHNLVPEVYNLADESPTARIKYGMEKDIPFLPASSFYGMYNKTSWYNGDYALKYGELVAPTRDTLVNAIQLCATQCSQGRLLDDWEIRSILHYFKSIAIQVKDLTITEKDMDLLAYYVAQGDKKGLELIHSLYNEKNDASFDDVKVPEIHDYKPNVENGAYIFNNGCLHCHGLGNNVTNFEFDDDKLTMQFLESQVTKYNHFSVPYLVRKGTYAVAGKKAYMPQYPLEKMSREQLVDLLAYISQNKSN